jgi:hypothetical protein
MVSPDDKLRKVLYHDFEDDSTSIVLCNSIDPYGEFTFKERPKLTSGSNQVLTGMS